MSKPCPKVKEPTCFWHVGTMGTETDWTTTMVKEWYGEPERLTNTDRIKGVLPFFRPVQYRRLSEREKSRQLYIYGGWGRTFYHNVGLFGFWWLYFIMIAVGHGCWNDKVSISGKWVSEYLLGYGRQKREDHMGLKPLLSVRVSEVRCFH